MGDADLLRIASVVPLVPAAMVSGVGGVAAVVLPIFQLIAGPVGIRIAARAAVEIAELEIRRAGRRNVGIHQAGTAAEKAAGECRGRERRDDPASELRQYAAARHRESGEAGAPTPAWSAPGSSARRRSGARKPRVRE